MEGRGAAQRGAFQFRLVGSFAVEVNGAPMRDRDVGSRKGRALLKLLLLHRGHTVSTDSIIEALWGERPPGKPEENVAALVSRLRAVVGHDAISGGRGGYRFVAGPGLAVDLDEAEQMVAEAERRNGAGQPALARAATEHARELLGAGRLFQEEASAEWVEAGQRELDRLVRRARRADWVASMELSDHGRAIEAAEAAVVSDPLDEEAYGVVMRAHHASGEPGRALAAYERLRTVLQEELGADPGPRTQALHLAILRGEPIVVETAPTAPTGAAPAVPDPGFVGRQQEIELLSKGWSAAAEGDPSLILIAGEAGIGKTRLADRVTKLARTTGGLVVQARCYEAERSLFLQPVVEAIRALVVGVSPDVLRQIAGEWSGTLAQLIPELGPVLRPLRYQRATPEMERRRSFEAVTAFLQSLAGRQPVLLLLDDLHNAGTSTVELLHFLFRRLAGARVFGVATLRAEEGTDVLDQLGDVAGVLELGPLPDHAVAELARSMGAEELTERILALTRGHPLFVVEALRAMVESPAAQGETPVPESLREAVLARVRRTGPDVEDLLRTAATLGSAFDLPTTARLMRLPLQEVSGRAERALRARLVVEGGIAYEFANDLIKEVVYQTTPLPTRAARHRLAADLLGVNPEVRAMHAAAGGDLARAVDAWLQAADRAARGFANRDAEELLNRAAEAAAAIGDDGRLARVRVARGRAREALSDWARAHDDQTEAVRLAQATGERAVEMQGLAELGGDLTVGSGGRTRDCLPYLDAALAIAEELEDRAAEVGILDRLSIVTSNQLRFDLGLEYGRRALARARDIGDDIAMARALDALKMAFAYTGDFRSLDAAMTELEPILRRHREQSLLAWALLEASFSPMARSDREEALARIEEPLVISRRIGDARTECLLLAHLCWIHRSAGAYEQALEQGERSIPVATHAWGVAFAHTMLGWAKFELFDLEGAAEHFERGLAAAERDGAENFLVRPLAHLVLASWKLGDAARAEQLARRAEDILGHAATPPGTAFLHGGHAYVAVARVRLALGDLDRVEALLSPLLQPAEASEWMEVLADASLVLGLARAAAGEPEGAEVRLARAAGIGEERGLPRIAWEARAALADLAGAQGRLGEESDQRQRARGIVDTVAGAIEDPALRQGYRRGIDGLTAARR